MNGPNAEQYRPRFTRDLSPTLLTVPYVEPMADVLSDHLGWHRAQPEFVARFNAALLRLTTAKLWRIALALKAGVHLESTAEISAFRWSQRFLCDYDMDLTMSARLLLHRVPKRPSYVVALDHTEWHFG